MASTAVMLTLCPLQACSILQHIAACNRCPSHRRIGTLPRRMGSQDESTLKSVTSPVTSGNTMQIRRSRCGNHTQETARRRAAYTAFVNSSYGQIGQPLALCPSPSPFCPELPAPARLRSRHLSSRFFSRAAWGRPCLQFRNSLNLLASPTGHQKIQRSASCRSSCSNISRTTEAMLFIRNAVCIMVQIGL
jgi:hypothetical protein